MENVKGENHVLVLLVVPYCTSVTVVIFLTTNQPFDSRASC